MSAIHVRLFNCQSSTNETSLTVYVSKSKHTKWYKILKIYYWNVSSLLLKSVYFYSLISCITKAVNFIVVRFNFSFINEIIEMNTYLIDITLQKKTVATHSEISVFIGIFHYTEYTIKTKIMIDSNLSVTKKKRNIIWNANIPHYYMV